MSLSPRRHLADRPIGVLAVLVSILVLGALAIPGMRIRLFSGSDFGGGGVYVSLGANGLSINETLDRITRPAEEIVRSLPAADQVSTHTGNGYCSVQVQAARGYSGQQLVTQMTQAFNTHRYRFPKEMRAPSVHSWSSESMPLAVVALNRGSLSDEAFRTFIDRELIPSLQTIPGVARAEGYRFGNNSVQVAFDAERLAALGLDSERAATVLTSGATPGPSYPLPSHGAGGSERHVRVLPLAVSPTTVGTVRLDGRTSLIDVATLEARDPRRDDFRILVDGQPGDGLVVYATADANVYRASHEVARVVAEECGAYGMTAHLVFNSHEAFDEIAHEILVAAAWCAGFSFLFLVVFLRRWRVAVLVCTALPLSLMMAAVAMAVSGSGLNLLSLIGFLLASGMVVDNAIVIAESLLRARDERDPAERRLVLRRAANAVAMAIVVSTLTTIAMFLPVIVSDENAGRMFMVALAEPIVWSLVASLVVALVLVPMAFVRLYPKGLFTGGRRHAAHSVWLIATERWYGRVLARILLRPVLGLGLTMLLIGLGVGALVLLPSPEQQHQNEDRSLDLRVRTTGKMMDMDQVSAQLSDWTRLLAPHRERLGITCVIANTWRSGGGLTVYLVPVDRAGRTSDDIRRELVRLLPPSPNLILDDHQEMARLAAQDRKYKEAAALAKAKKEKEEKEKAEKEKLEKEKLAKEKAEKETLAKEKTASNTEAAQKQEGTSAAKDTTTASDAQEDEDEDEDEKVTLETDWLTFTLSAPDPRAVKEAKERLSAVLVAEGGLADLEKKRNRSYGREREERPDRGNLTLSLTRAAEEQGWQAEQVAQQVARFTGGERATEMPGGWYLSFGRTRTSDRTLSHLLETVVYQPTSRTSPSTRNPASKPATPATPASKSTTSGGAKTPAPTTASSRSTKATDDAALLPVNAPLLNLVQPAVAPREQTISRVNGLTHDNLQVVIRSSERKRILTSFPVLLKRANIPDGVTVKLAQEREDLDDGMRTIWIALFAAAAIIYLLMCILYESLLAPLTVMTTVPAGIVSVMGVFSLARMPLDPMVMLGLFLLVGIVINHGVVLVDRLGVTVPMHRLPRPAGGISRRALLGIAAASRRRFTPVLLTSLTTIAAAVPMAFSPGRIFGIPINGLGVSLSIGLTAATVFTLVVVPVVYQWLGICRAGTIAMLRGGRTA